MKKSICPCCRREFEPRKAKQVFCDSTRRFRSWAAREVVRAYRAGEGDGLKDIVMELVKR